MQPLADGQNSDFVHPEMLVEDHTTTKPKSYDSEVNMRTNK